jgi:hypothetical protein
LKGPSVRENKGSDLSFGYFWNNCWRAITRHLASCAGDNAILLPWQNWSVFDFGR